MKNKLSPEEKKDRRRYKAFKNKIRNTFVNSGFEYLNTQNKHIKIGHRVIEIDAIFFYENILLICEDTTAKNKIKDHIRNKKEAFDQIQINSIDLFEWLCESFPEKRDKLGKYSYERYNIYNLYFSESELDLSDDEMSLYSNIFFIQPKTLNYLYRMMQCVKKSARYEIFRFLNIDSNQIGIVSSESHSKTIETTIICPKDSTGLKNGVGIVSFMMSAESLIKTCYVMRKDNWEDAVWLYQRLIDKKKIKNIRQFLAKKEETFFNNIIVGLPDGVRFENHNRELVSINQVGNHEVCKMVIPDEMNSICIIDGQHRIYAHYEGGVNDKSEARISILRKKLHLLVTGLVFPPSMTNIERAQIQSEIFLDINSNAKPVPADVLLHIEMLRDPYSNIGLARQIIERLNRKQIFLNRFELSPLDESKEIAKIKVASIVKFALRYLVTIKPSEGRVSLYDYWSGNKEALENKDDVALTEYIVFCVKQLESFFSAVRATFIDSWNDKNSKLLSVTSINGFIIALNRQLSINGVREFKFYQRCLRKLTVDFSKEEFPYTSSQYRKFSTQILSEAFEIKEPDDEDASFIKIENLHNA